MGFILLIVFILIIFRTWKQSSLRTRQHGEKTHANKSIPCPWCFLCIYMHIYTYLHDICQRLDNTRVGANCNSPFHMGAIENMGDSRQKRTQLHRANCNSPLQRAQTYSHHAHDVFLCICMHICERSENIRVGANCNSPFHMGAIENMGELNYGRIELWANCITYSAAPARGLCPYDTRKKPHANINDQWLITSVHWPLFTDLCSLFTLHSSLFTDLSPPTSILISHNDSSWLVHQKCCTFASNLKQVLGVSLRNPNTP